MKPTDLDPNFWKTEADEGEGWAGFIAAGAAFVICLIALYLWLITFAVAR